MKQQYHSFVRSSYLPCVRLCRRCIAQLLLKRDASLHSRFKLLTGPRTRTKHLTTALVLKLESTPERPTTQTCTQHVYLHRDVLLVPYVAVPVHGPVPQIRMVSLQRISRGEEGRSQLALPAWPDFGRCSTECLLLVRRSLDCRTTALFYAASTRQTTNQAIQDFGFCP